MEVMASDAPALHSPCLRLDLTAHQPSRRHHTQSLLGPSFDDPRTPHVLESHPEQAALLSRRDDERRHAVGSHSALALRLYLAACNPPQLVADESWTTSAPFCLNHFTLAKSRKPDLSTCLCVFTFSSSALAFLIDMNFSVNFLCAIWSSSLFHYYFFLSIVSWQYQKYSTILIFVLCLLCVTPLVCSSFSSFGPSSPFFSS